ncbi:hypothetical protein [Ammoniphilus sp. 3BR4]|uniref:hypothetical protein n=1 Tax=Ammoniphilus sp. 3BR4 TaxID=3158265 RepID=UPI003467A2D9
MGLFQKSGRKQIDDDNPQRSQECPECKGKGFYQYGLEFAHIHECPACEGNGSSLLTAD